MGLDKTAALIWEDSLESAYTHGCWMQRILEEYLKAIQPAPKGDKKSI